jgi:hypothetical protein
VFGQWSWDGVFGLSQRAHQNFIDDEKVGAFDQRELGFGLGVNGFIMHPAFANFQAGVEGTFADYQGVGARDSTRWGFRGLVNLFPIGKYRARVFATRRLYDYADITEEDPFTLRGLPDTSSTLGGRFRVTGGRLRGTLVGLERTSFDFLDPAADKEVAGRDFVDWSATGRKFQRHIRLERRFRDFGTVDFQSDHLAANFEQLGDLSELWRWNLFGVATRDTSSGDSGVGTVFDSFRIRNQLFRDMRENDLLDLRYSGGLLRSTGRSAFETHAISALYRWRPRSQLEVAPFTGYGVRLSERLDVHTPDVGVSAVWNRRGVAIDTLLNTRVSYTVLQLSGGNGSSRTDSVVGLAGNFMMGHGVESRLRTELEGEWSRNQVRVGDEAIVDVPELGLPLTRAGLEDFIRGRVTLRRQWRSLLFSGYGEWSRRKPTGDLALDGFSADSVTQTVQVSSRWLDFLFNLGELQIQRPELPDSQDVRFVSAALSFRPWRLLRLRASYRSDTRRLILSPDVDGDRAEVGAELRLGAFDIEVRAFTTAERLIEMTERSNRGVTWTLSRGFQGWLPIVTRGPRGGVIR